MNSAMAQMCCPRPDRRPIEMRNRKKTIDELSEKEIENDFNTEEKIKMISPKRKTMTYKDIMPYFYEGRISQKILRNDESIEMMNIIRDTRHYDLGTVYGTYNDFSNKISEIIKQ